MFNKKKKKKEFHLFEQRSSKPFQTGPALQQCVVVSFLQFYTCVLGSSDSDANATAVS